MSPIGRFEASPEGDDFGNGVDDGGARYYVGKLTRQVMYEIRWRSAPLIQADWFCRLVGPAEGHQVTLDIGERRVR